MHFDKTIINASKYIKNSPDNILTEFIIKTMLTKNKWQKKPYMILKLNSFLNPRAKSNGAPNNIYDTLIGIKILKICNKYSNDPIRCSRKNSEMNPLIIFNRAVTSRAMPIVIFAKANKNLVLLFLLKYGNMACTSGSMKLTIV